MHGVHVTCSATAPTAVANGGVACGTRLLWHLIMRWVASDFGSKARGRKRKGEENSAASKWHHFVPFFLFFQTHETTSFCLKRAVPFK
jgi:hypothetical protein